MLKKICAGWFGVVLCFFKRFSAVSAGYIDLAGCLDDSAAAGADMFDALIDGFYVSTFEAVWIRLKKSSFFSIMKL